MKTGLCTITNKDQSVESVMSMAADCGYDGVEIWGREPHIENGDDDTCERISNHAKTVGLEIPVYGSYLRAGTDEFDDQLADELRIADALGAPLIRVWAGTQEYQDRTADHWEQVVADLRTLSREAAGRGVEVSVEKHQGTLTNLREGARRLIEAVDSDNCGLNYQPLFFYTAEELKAEARELAPYSNNVHVQAVSKPTGHERCLLENAYFDCDAILEPFHETSVAGYVEVEFVDQRQPYPEAARRDLEHLRSTA